MIPLLCTLLFGVTLHAPICSASPRLHRYLERAFDDMRPSNDVIPSHMWKRAKRDGIMWVKRTMYEDANSVEDYMAWSDVPFYEDTFFEIEKRALNQKCDSK